MYMFIGTRMYMHRAILAFYSAQRNKVHYDFQCDFHISKVMRNIQRGRN